MHVQIKETLTIIDQSEGIFLSCTKLKAGTLVHVFFECSYYNTEFILTDLGGTGLPLRFPIANRGWHCSTNQRNLNADM